MHDLKHTFGRRLRAADVPEEDRKALLGHTDGSITSHYSAAELTKLIEYANRIAATDTRSPAGAQARGGFNREVPAKVPTMRKGVSDYYH